MTKQRTYFARCPNCGEYPAKCAKCGGKATGSTPFSDWLRNLPAPYDSTNISLQNLDYVWHNYKENWLITLEEKQYGLSCSSAQRDTHAIVFQLLSLASKILKAAHGAVRSTMKNNWRQVEYRGHYVVTFENTTPDDSEWIRINGNETDKEGLLNFLRIGSLEN